MANWQNEIDLTGVWESGDISLISKTIVKKLKLIPNITNDIDWDREGLIYQFEDLSKDNSSTVKDFNYTMNDLYDWADISIDGKWNGKKVCWIKKF